MFSPIPCPDSELPTIPANPLVAETRGLSAQSLRVSINLPHRRRNLLNVRVAPKQYRVMQHHRSIMGLLHLGQIAAAAIAAGRPADVQSAKSLVERNSFGPHRRHKSLSGKSEA